MSVNDWISLRAEIWQAPDGTVTWITSATEQPGGLLITFGTGFSCYYADLAAARYTRLSPS